MSERKSSSEENLEALIGKCIEGERTAQNEIYKIFAPKMLNVCMRYSKSREEAEDTLIESFLKVFENLHKFRNQGSLEGWIRRIMVNTAIEKFRRKGLLYASYSVDEMKEVDFSTTDILGDMAVKELIQLVQDLPSGYRMVFNLYAFEGLKHKEIAERLGISEGTSKSNLFDARAILRREVEKSLKQAKASNE